jgi:squalene synthase HpnC
MVPKKLRPHFYSIYAFSRGVDDLGDVAEGDRLALLDLWEKELDACYLNSTDSNGPTHPYFTALAQTIQLFNIPADPFKRLIEANRRDQKTTRTETFDDLLEYCTYSANPVGHLVLYLCGIKDKKLQRLADLTCTALQLANFWQDVNRDLQIGRIYIPLEDMNRFGISEHQVALGKADDNFRAMMRFEIDRTRRFFVEGYSLAQFLDPSIRSDFALFTRGGLSILQQIERKDFDVLSYRPTVSMYEKGKILASTWIRSKLGISLVPNSAFKSVARHT